MMLVRVVCALGVLAAASQAASTTLEKVLVNDPDSETHDWADAGYYLRDNQASGELTLLQNYNYCSYNEMLLFLKVEVIDPSTWRSPIIMIDEDLRRVLIYRSAPYRNQASIKVTGRCYNTRGIK
ncbi:hypothetical protein O0L34_g3746 [Tuta absoluta]|nr:hypothetical protein O0L34_g3746 [Tuta absoluta]